MKMLTILKVNYVLLYPLRNIVMVDLDPEL